MNKGADPLGYRILSRHLASLREAGSDTTGLLQKNQYFLRMAAYSLMAIALILAIAALHAAKFVAIPVVAGIVIGLIIGPVGDRGHQWGIPKALTFALLVVALAGAIGLTIWLALPVMQIVLGALPEALERLRRVLDFARDWLSTFDQFRGGKTSLPAGFQPVEAAPPSPTTNTVDLATSALAIVTPALSQAIIFLFSLTLFLASRSHWRLAFAQLFVEREHRLHVLKSYSAIENQLANYFLVVTGINLGVGIVVGGLFWLAGIPAAFSWAVLAFMLNYLPVVGPLFLKVLLVAFGFLIYPDFGRAVLPVGLFLMVSLIEGNLVTPKIVGARITMDPLTVFLTVVFFTWLWGFAGAFLAMPLLAIAAVVFQRKDEALRLPS